VLSWTAGLVRTLRWTANSLEQRRHIGMVFLLLRLIQPSYDARDVSDLIVALQMLFGISYRA